MKTNPPQASAWETSLTYLISRVSPLLAKSVESKVCRKLGLECRHVGLLNYLEDSGGSVHLSGTRSKGRAPAPTTTLDIIELFGELFWGPQFDQKQPDLQVQALLGPLEEQGLVIVFLITALHPAKWPYV